MRIHTVLLLPTLRASALAAVLSSALISVAYADDANSVAVGAQYDTTHVYVPLADVNQFASSFVATFGGKSTPQGVATVTPTASSTTTQLLQTPYGTVSLFGFKTPIPYGFGSERTGYLVTDLDTAVKAAQAAGAAVVVAPFDDPIGRDVVIQWPGGVNMQLYWHTTAPHYAPFALIPENRVYVSPDKADEFIGDFIKFAHGTITQDSATAPATEIGRSSGSYRRVRISSTFGRMTVLVTDGHLPWPYGREMAGYAVPSLRDTLSKAQASGAQLLVAPYVVDGRTAAMVQFPGGYIAEIHQEAQ
ncbi:hypothetical protein [Amantichitinum ursilacus]|uniref:Glyoxalase-like domain protein n=1 Tax=Amantichitinum ursilacus TaxID=857265 RepID=A0A0N0XLD2_9NEIS|nr:hypothetical protein [Amantichitinum ursilacus]KPC55416.1 Glyoxalase-like domain protein [Amantichitinum ursilacus]